MNRDEVVAKAAEAMCSCGLAPLFTKSGPCSICRGRAIKLDSAGLLATPEMRECAEACKDFKTLASPCSGDYERLRRAGRAYAASVQKPERYEADDSVVVDTAELRRAVAAFYGLGRARHAREWAAKLNAEDRP